MIFGIMLDSDKFEKDRIRQCLSNLTAHCTEEKLEWKVFRESDSLMEAVEQVALLDMAVIDVTMQGALQAARMIRKQFAKAEILVIADVSVSPMQYMHPSIRASALLLRPQSSVWEEALHDFYEGLPVVREKQKERKNNELWIKNKEGRFRIPFEQIYYLEAREKKVFIRTKQAEFGVAETMEKLAEQLPQNFVKCHRSFVVNEEHITKIKLSENLLYLGKDLFVPVSRSYKGLFKRNLE